MLKIKDNVDLKELEKEGYKFNENRMAYVYKRGTKELYLEITIGIDTRETYIYINRDICENQLYQSIGITNAIETLFKFVEVE